MGLASLTAAFNPLHALNLNKQELQNPNNKTFKIKKRKLGKLKVSGIGIAVQNMSRTYQTTIPNRTQMRNVIQSAYEQGVTLFDAAEAYGPWEVEKILGESIKGFRHLIKITTKFGWNIDQITGKRLPGLNSKPAHIR